MMQKFWTLKPPVNERELDEIYCTVLSDIPASEVSKRLYFQTCWNSLIQYALVYKKQRQNFSMSIGFFHPNIGDDDDRLFSEENQWVKVRVSGGMGKAFRSRYMAVEGGLVKIDWISGLRRFTKQASLFAGTWASYVALHASAMGNLGDAVKSFGDGIQESFAEEAGERIQNRIQHSTVHQIFEATEALPYEALARMRGTGEIDDYKQLMLGALHKHEPEEIDLEKFRTLVGSCWSDVWSERYFQEHSTMGKMNHQQFADAFVVFVENRALAK